MATVTIETVCTTCAGNGQVRVGWDRKVVVCPGVKARALLSTPTPASAWSTYSTTTGPTRPPARKPMNLQRQRILSEIAANWAFVAALAFLVAMSRISCAVPEAFGKGDSHETDTAVVAGLAVVRVVSPLGQSSQEGQSPGRTARVFRVTAYCPCSICCGKYADGITASGRPVTHNGGRFVAAPKSMKFGTMLSIPGYNGSRPVPVLDRGGKIGEGRLDVFFDSHDEALQWGVQHLKVMARQ